MSKQEFFKKLRRALRWTFTHEEMADILTDYDGFFASGHAEGKDEVTICAELGDPANIARELAKELDKKRSGPTRVKVFTRMLLTLLTGFIGYYLGNILPGNILPLFTKSTNGNTLLAILLYAALISVLWLLLVGFTRKLPAVAPTSQRIPKGLRMVCHIAILGIVIANYTFACISLSTVLQEQSLSSMVSVFFSSVEPITRFIPLLIAVISVYGFYRASLQWLAVISHALGASVFLWTLGNNLGNISNPEVLHRVSYALIVYGVSLVVTALLAVFIRMGSGRKA